MTGVTEKKRQGIDYGWLIIGMCSGAGSTAFVAGQPDWWIWLLVATPAVLWRAWKDVAP